MAIPTRDKMIAGAADLLRRWGMHATSMREVVRHSNTPRGSIAHHFPGGKRQLLEAAVQHAGQEVSVPLQRLMGKYGPVSGLASFIGLWRQVLEESGFEAGCAVLAVSIEKYASDQREPDPQQEHEAQQTLLDQANEIFEEWRQIISSSLQQAGVPGARATGLAVLAIASIEGSVALCRAARSSEPLDQVWEELRLSFERELNQLPT